MLMTSQPQDLKTKLSALELNLGPSMVTIVPLSWTVRLRSRAVFVTSDRVFSQNEGCMGMWETVPKLGPLVWSWNVWGRLVVLVFKSDKE